MNSELSQRWGKEREIIAQRMGWPVGTLPALKRRREFFVFWEGRSVTSSGPCLPLSRRKPGDLSFQVTPISSKKLVHCSTHPIHFFFASR